MPDSRIKILYIIGSMGNGRAGTEKSLLTICETLNRDSFDPLLISLQDCEFMRIGKFVCATRCWNVYSTISPEIIPKRRELIRFIREHEFDIVQTFFVEAHLLGGSAARAAGVKVIVSSRRNLGYAYNLKERMMLKLANRFPTRFLANSKSVVSAISRIEGIDQSRFDVIHNGIELRPSVPYDQHQRELIVMTANLRPIKAIPMLIRAAKRVIEQFPNARFRIIGEGPSRMQLQSLIADLKLQAYVAMTGSTSDVHSAISRAGIGVLTSSSEGFSSSLLEYMRAGLPVIATRVGGNSEVVEEGKNGYLVNLGDDGELADRIIQLLRDPSLAQRMGEAGRLLVAEKFSVSAMVTKLQDYYTELLTSRTL